MKLKTIFLSGILGLSFLAAAQAQVYSVNVVGYVSKSVPPGFSMIANQLNSTNNTLGALLPTAPDGFQVFKFNSGFGYSTYTYDALQPGWLPDGNITLNPGEGVFVHNNQATNVTLVFAGEVSSSSNNIPMGYSIKSSGLPVAGSVDTVLAIPAQDGDQIFKFTPGSGYSTFTFDALQPGWLPSAPTIQVGEAFFIKKGAPASWVQVFTNQ